MPETTETFLACHEWDTPLGARGKGRDLLTSGSSFSRQARLGQGINPPPKLHGRREPGAPRTHSQRALGARGPDEEPNRQPDPQAQRSARVSTRPPLHRRALPTTAQPEEEPGRNGGTRSYKKPSATVELGIQGLAASGSWTLLMRADRGVWEAFHAMVKSSAWGSSLFQVGRPDPGDHSSTFFGIFMPVSSGAHAASEPSGGERRAGFGCLRGSVRPQYGQRKSRRMILR